MEQFLHLLSEEDAAPHLLRPALQSAMEALPAVVRERLTAAAAEVCLSQGDFLTYSLLEGLPFSFRLLAGYVPRALAFLVRRSEGQNGLLGMALLPTLVRPQWRSRGLYHGLGLGVRPGLHLGVNQGLAAAVLMAPGSQWLNPGVPPGVALEFCLEIARSPEAALALLADLRPARSSQHLLYDPVQGSAMLVEVGLRPRVTDVSEPFLVLSSAGPAAEPNEECLRTGLQANQGWLTPDKGLALLHRALPGSFGTVLDLDGREGLLDDGESRQAVRF